MKAKKRSTLFNPAIPEQFNPKQIPQQVPLTTAHVLGVTPSTVPIIPVPAVNIPGANLWNTGVTMTGGNELDPPIMHLQGLGQSMLYSQGIYLVPGPTSGGKTLLCKGIVAWANDCGIPATYLSTFEPHSPRIDVGGIDLFVKPQDYWIDMEKMIVPASTPTVVRVIVGDSITLPILEYPAQRGEATMKGGMQPRNRAFLALGNTLASKYNLCLLLTVNQNQIPFIAELSGAIEGIINVIDVGRFEMIDRVKGMRRQSRYVALPNAIVNAVLAQGGYASYSSTTTQSNVIGFGGF